MSDLISRQAAIEALEQIRFALWEIDIPSPTVPEYVEHHRDVQNVMKKVDEIREKVEQLPSVQPKWQWIPCSERLPEEKDAGILKKLGTNKRSDYVLATVDVKGERMTVTACTYDGAWHWDKKYAFPDYKVVAWMPLPEPYKGVE